MSSANLVNGKKEFQLCSPQIYCNSPERGMKTMIYREQNEHLVIASCIKYSAMYLIKYLLKESKRFVICHKSTFCLNIKVMT